jgi:hypothetical protein
LLKVALKHQKLKSKMFVIPYHVYDDILWYVCDWGVESNIDRDASAVLSWQSIS